MNDLFEKALVTYSVTDHEYCQEPLCIGAPKPMLQTSEGQTVMATGSTYIFLWIQGLLTCTSSREAEQKKKTF